MERYIFLHIPKTAGTAIHAILPNQNWHNIPDRILCNKDVKNKIYQGKIHHYTTDQHIDSGLFIREDFESSFVFCFVRNPWDRMVSSYFYAKKNFGYSDNFSAFANWACDLVESNRSHITTRYASANHLRPQVEYIDNKYNLHPNMICRFENIEKDVEILKQKIGFNGELVKKNVSFRKRDYKIYYNESLKQRVGDVYGDDVNQFGYLF